jgi:hypothetical protein
MARTAVAYSKLLPNSSIATPAGTSISSGAGNGGQIAAAYPEQTMLRAVFTTAGNVVVKAGANPPALAAGLGDLTVAVGTNGDVLIGPLESGRFLQADGSLIVETTQTVTLTAVRMPRNT